MAQDIPAPEPSELIPASALLHVPGCEGGAAPQAVQRLYGGTVNTSLRIDTRAGRFVLRLHHPAGGVLGSDHVREARLQAAAAAIGVAPALIYVDPAHRFMIMRFIEGTTWTCADFGRLPRLQSLGARLRLLHGIPPPAVAAFDLAALIRGHIERLERSEPGEKAALQELSQRARSALRDSGERAPCIVHHDLHYSNLIDGDELYLIDWEYAAVADPLFDLACVLAYYPHARIYASELLDAAGLAEHVTLSMLRAATEVFVILSALWERLRAFGA